LFTLITTPLLKLFNTVYQTLEAGYEQLLNVALKRAPVTLGIILISAATCYTLLPRLPVALLPNMAQGEFYVEVELQPGATIYETDTVLAELGNVIATSDELNAAVARYYTIAGTGSLLNAAPGQSGNQWGRLNVVMANHNIAATEKVQQQLRQKVQSMPGVMAKFGTPELFSFASPITIEFVGYDLALLQQAAQQFSTTLEEHPQFTDIRVNMTDGQPELAVYFDHAKLSQYGLTSAEVSELLATKIGG